MHMCGVQAKRWAVPFIPQCRVLLFRRGCRQRCSLPSDQPPALPIRFDPDKRQQGSVLGCEDGGGTVEVNHRVSFSLASGAHVFTPLESGKETSTVEFATASGNVGKIARNKLIHATGVASRPATPERLLRLEYLRLARVGSQTYCDKTPLRASPLPNTGTVPRCFCTCAVPATE